jgi:phosphohistidine phosphatase
MRHGKAEFPSDAKSDSERELTSIGRKKIKQAARGLAQCLFAGREVHIWTSPSVRTVQTAELIKAAFGKNAHMKVVDAIAENDLNDLRSEWAKVPGLDVLIIVGHEPMISIWTEKLCKVSLIFRPASAASVFIDEKTQESSSLAWFMRAGVMARLCPPDGTHRRQRS